MKSNPDEYYELPFASSKPYTFDRFVRMLVSIAVIVGIIMAVRAISNVLIPFFIALLLAYLMNPMVLFIQEKCRVKHRGISVFITLILFLSAITGALLWLIPRVLNEITNMSQLLRDYLNTHDYQSIIPGDIQIFVKDIFANQNFQALLNAENVKQITSIISTSIQSLFTSSLSIISGIIGVLLVLLYLFFISLDFKKLENSWQNLIPYKHRSLINDISEDLKLSMKVYFRAQTTIAMIVGVLMAIGFSIISLPMAITLGLFIGVLNIVPYLQVVGFIPAVFLSLLKAIENGQDFFQVFLGVFIVIAIVQVIQETILIPRIMGKAYNMNPAIILLSLSIWGSIMGLLGMLLALPFTTLIISYYKQLVLREKVENPANPVTSNSQDKQTEPTVEESIDKS
jgi:predicted PurR-regulated permease PerM